MAAPTDGVTGDECPAGTFCEAGSFTPEYCEIGTYSGAAGATSDAACTNCDAGFKCHKRGLTAPVTNCPAGYYCEEHPTQMKPCEPGHECPEGQDAMDKCPSGQYQPYEE